MANETGSDENLCFFITRIGEEGSSGRAQADGVMDAIVKSAAKELPRAGHADRFLCAQIRYLAVNNPSNPSLISP